jgi:hypothetical protein
MGEIVPVITEGRRVLVQEFAAVLFVGFLIPLGNLPTDLFLVFHV